MTLLLRSHDHLELIATCRGAGGVPDPRAAASQPPRPLQPRRQRLQREQLPPGPGTDRDPVGDQVPDLVSHRTRFAAGGQPRVLDVALDQAMTLEHLGDTRRNLLDERLQQLPRDRPVHDAEHERQRLRIGRRKRGITARTV